MEQQRQQLASLETFAGQLGLSKERILDLPEHEFRKGTKNTNVLQRAKLCRERKVLKKETFPTSIENIQALCEEANASMEEILALSLSSLANLSMDILGNKLHHHVRLVQDYDQHRGAANGVAYAPLPEVYVSSVESDITTEQAYAGREAAVSSSSAGTTFQPEIKVKSKCPPTVPIKVEPKNRPEPAASRKKSAKKSAVTPGRGESVRDRICRVLLELRALGIHEPPRTQVAMYAGYPEITKSKAFTNVVCNLKTTGFVEYPDQHSLRLTSLAIQSLEPVAPFKDNCDVQERLKDIIRNAKNCPAKSKALRIFESLSDGKIQSKVYVAKIVGYDDVASDSLSNILSWMNTHGLIIRSTDSLQLADIAFPFGRTETTDEQQSFKHPPAPISNTESALESSGVALGKQIHSAASVTSINNETTATKKRKTKTSGKASTRDRILRALCELRAINIVEAPTMTVLFMSGYHNISSTGVRPSLVQLENQGFIERKGGKIRLTNFAVSHLIKSIDPPKDGIDLQNRLINMIREVAKVTPPVEKTKLFLEKLSDGKSHTVAEMLEATDYKGRSSTGFQAICSAITQLGLLKNSKGMIQPSETGILLLKREAGGNVPFTKTTEKEKTSQEATIKHLPEKAKEVPIPAPSQNEHKLEYTTGVCARAERSAKRMASEMTMPSSEQGAISHTESSAKGVAVTPPLTAPKKQKTSRTEESPLPDSPTKSSAPKQEDVHQTLLQQLFFWRSGTA